MLCQCGTRCSNDPLSPRALYVAGVKWRGTDGPGPPRRVANVASAAPVPLQSVSLQYWFNGPDGVAQFETAAPNDLFQLKCSDATTGECGGPARRPPLPLRWWERLPAGGRGGGVLSGEDLAWKPAIWNTCVPKGIEGCQQDPRSSNQI